MNGRSQAVRLPAEFRFESKRVFIYRDPRTGNVILSEKPQTPSWRDFMALRAQLGSVDDDCSIERLQDNDRRDPFEHWTE